MKGIKNSLRKLGSTLSFRESVQSADGTNDVSTDIESKRNHYRECIAKIVTYRGYEFPDDAVHTRVLENIEDLEVRENDVFVLSYPGTSSHFLEDMVQSLVIKSESNRNQLNNQIETEVDIPIARLEVSNPYGHSRWLKSLKSPRILASHLPYDLLPRQMKTPNCKIIYLVRNPKDHIVAYYYHHRLRGVQISLDDFIDLYLNGNLLYGSYFEHVVSFWQFSKMYPDNAMFVLYEELKIITLSIANLIAKFLDLSLSKDEIKEIVSQKHGTINIISKNEFSMEQEPERITALKTNKFHGVLGDWVNYFNSEQASKVDEMIRIKFESQKLLLTNDPTVAIKRIEKHGRIIGNDESCKSKILTNGTKQSLLSLAPRSKSTFRKKPIFTKDEAVFIRRKDKVVIIEETDQDRPKHNFLKRFFSTLCCYCCLARPESSQKVGYTPF